MAGRVGNVTRIPPGGYGFSLQDDKKDAVIYLTFETQAEAEDAHKLVAEAFARQNAQWLHHSVKRPLRAPDA
jgi:hypothetical protein